MRFTTCYYGICICGMELHSQNNFICCLWKEKWSLRSQVANTRPAGQTRPSTPCFIWPSTLFLPSGRAELSLNCQGVAYIYAVLKLHLALWRQPWGWCGPWWKWVWYPCLRWMCILFSIKYQLWLLIIKDRNTFLGNAFSTKIYFPKHL